MPAGSSRCAEAGHLLTPLLRYNDMVVLVLDNASMGTSRGGAPLAHKCSTPCSFLISQQHGRASAGWSPLGSSIYPLTSAEKYHQRTCSVRYSFASFWKETGGSFCMTVIFLETPELLDQEALTSDYRITQLQGLEMFAHHRHKSEIQKQHTITHVKVSERVELDLHWRDCAAEGSARVLVTRPHHDRENALHKTDEESWRSVHPTSEALDTRGESCTCSSGLVRFGSDTRWAYRRGLHAQQE
eukprot:2715905-Amphidinium_carterae.2